MKCQHPINESNVIESSEQLLRGEMVPQLLSEKEMAGEEEEEKERIRKKSKRRWS